MSHKDKRTIRKDKILDVLRRYVALSTTQITRIVNKRYAFHFNKKTIERDIADLKKEGKVVPNPPIGREQTYSISRKPRRVSEFFINEFWKDLHSIRRLNVEDSVDAFWHLRSLIKTYHEMYEELKGDVEKTQRSLKAHSEKKQQGHYYFGNFILCAVPEVEDLIGKTATFLHEQFEKLQSKEHVKLERPTTSHKKNQFRVG